MRRITIALALALAGAAACSDDSSSVPDAAASDVTARDARTTADGTATTVRATTTWPSTTLSAFPPTTVAPTTTRPAPTTCSAMGMSRDLPPQPELPAPVAATRQAIVDAAVTCDWDALRALAAVAGDEFVASFGGMEPLGLWQSGEPSPNGPLRAMVIVLRAPYRSSEFEQGLLYGWPEAFGADPLTDAHRLPVAELYSQDTWDRFRQGDGYGGYRAVIKSDGTWTAFVEGD